MKNKILIIMLVSVCFNSQFIQCEPAKMKKAPYSFWERFKRMLCYTPGKAVAKPTITKAFNKKEANNNKPESRWNFPLFSKIWISLGLAKKPSVPVIIPKNCGHSEMRGRRETMEDAYDVRCDGDTCLYGLYDGHGGDRVAKYVAQHLNEIILKKMSERSTIKQALCNGYKEVDDDLPGSPDYVGTTAVTALINKSQIVVANVGDSRAVLCSDGKVIKLSEDHKPDRSDERIRIEKLAKQLHYKGEIITSPSQKGDVCRVKGNLAVSRAIGDWEMQPYVTPDPEIKIHPRSPNDQFLILACDGVWDVITNEKAVEIVQKVLKKEGSKLKDVATALVQAAYDAQSTDNISVIIVDLTKNK